MTNPIVVARQTKNADGRVGTRHCYWCPGCDALHCIAIRPHTQDNGAGWTFEGSLECPTYAPSQLTTWRSSKEERRCHTFIRQGMIQFLDDCTHELKGQTVPMVPVPDWLVREEQERGDTPEEV